MSENGTNGIKWQPKLTTNSYPQEPEPLKPLNIAIIGAGIGGLSAAIGFRRQGHHVSIYEASQFAEETGAAIHLAPNANGLLRRYGVIPEEFGAVNMNHIAEYNEKNESQRKVDLREPNKLWQHPWQLSHRIRLHNALKKAAIFEGGKGRPAVLHLSSKVLKVDPHSATLELADSTKVTADVVIGADGIYSKTRACVTGSQSELFTSGKAAFRFLLPRKEVEADTKTAGLVGECELAMWYAADRRIVVYPCNDNELLNFVCIHPEIESQSSGDEWNKQGSLEQLLKVYENFDPKILALLGKADAKSLKVWKLLDMKPLPTWTNDRLALLGDAAHPFLPHQGQGGGVAIEDAVSLAVVLPLGTTVDEIPERLKLYEEIRYERANKIQEFSRQAGKDWVDGKPQIDMMAYTVYNFGWDEYDNSTNRYWKFQRAKNPRLYWRSPIAFGPAPGPRQDVYGEPRPSLAQTFVTASIKFKTSRTFLQNLFPNEKYKFKSPGTVAYASFSATTLGNMVWLGGGGYNHFGLYIHGVEYTKKDGSSIVGTYMPVLFESLSDPIVTGRDELGMPKVYCDIDIQRTDSSYHMQASWRGARFVDMKLDNLASKDPKSEAGTIGGEADYGILVYRYVPAVGERGKADAEYPVCVAHADETVPQTVKNMAVPESKSIKIEGLDWKRLPTLHNITSVLAEIPIYEIVASKVVEGTGVPDVSAAKRIE